MPFTAVTVPVVSEDVRPNFWTARPTLAACVAEEGVP